MHFPDNGKRSLTTFQDLLVNKRSKAFSSTAEFANIANTRQLSGNITFTKSVKWSATDAERLYSATNCAKSISFFEVAEVD